MVLMHIVLLEHLYFSTSFPFYAGGFLTFKPSIPKSLLLDGEHNITSHFSLINYQVCMYKPILINFYNLLDITKLLNIFVNDSVQLKQIRTALAIASLLNRTLVRTIYASDIAFCYLISLRNFC